MPNLQIMFLILAVLANITQVLLIIDTKKGKEIGMSEHMIAFGIALFAWIGFGSFLLDF